MKKRMFGILTAVLALSMIFTMVSCNPEPTDENYTVNFVVDGGSPDPGSITVEKGAIISAPTAPTKADHTFGGWYSDNGFTVPWDFAADTVNGNLTLYAKWVSNSTPTVVSVTVLGPGKVAVGGTATFSVTVVVTGSVSQDVSWTVEGADSDDTTITAGTLSVGDDETAESLTIKATSTTTTTVSGTLTVEVVPEGTAIPTVTKVTVSPATASVAKGQTETFTATVEGEDDPAQTVTWTVTGSSASSISAEGVLSVGANETATILTVKATSTFDTSKSGTVNVIVTSGITEPYEPVDPSDFVETLALENSAYAIYKFVLPPDGTFGDYVGISFDVKLVNPENAGPEGTPGRVQIRDIRLMGRYLGTDFITQDPATNPPQDIDAYLARYVANSNNTVAENKLNGYIAGQRAAWSNDYAALGWDSATNDFFTIEYVLTGMDGTGETAGTNQPVHADNIATNWPAATDTGPFYFGLGINGVNGNLIVQQIKNIKLIANPEYGIDDLYSIGSGFDKPAYAAYIDAGRIPGAKVGNAWRDMGDSSKAAPIYVWFDTNGAPGSSSVWTFPGETITYPSNPTWDGFLFKEWNSEADGTGTAVTAKTFTTNTVVYAQWEVDENWTDVPAWDTLTNKLDLGVFNWVNNANQQGYATKGGFNSGGEPIEDADLELADLQNAIYLVLEVGSLPTGGGSAYLHVNGKTSPWSGGNAVFSNSGEAVADFGVQYDSEDGDKIIIQLSKAFHTYSELAEADGWARFFIQYYGADNANWSALSLTNGYLLFADNYVVQTGFDGVVLQLPPSWNNSDNQKGWRSSGASDAAAAYLSLEDLLEARFIVVELSKFPQGLEIIWANEGAGWKASPIIKFGWNNEIDGTEQGQLDQTGATLVPKGEGYILTIPLATSLDDYTDFTASATWAGILLQVGDWANAVTKAYLAK